MTRSSAWTDTDHPSVMLKAGHCSKCRYEFDYKLLEPFILANSHIQLLCPSCRMDREPTCKEQ